MYSLYEKLIEDKNKNNDNKFIEPNKVQTTSFQPQTTTLKGSISNTENNWDSNNENNSSNRFQSAQNALSSGVKGFQQYKSGGGTPWGAIAGAGKNLYNAITDKSPSEYSDTEQSIIYPLQGAATGAQFGPWGAAGGALYGLGYSFKDDLGLKDSNFFTKLLFPIGMGDGGGFIDMG